MHKFQFRKGHIKASLAAGALSLVAVALLIAVRVGVESGKLVTLQSQAAGHKCQNTQNQILGVLVSITNSFYAYGYTFDNYRPDPNHPQVVDPLSDPATTLIRDAQGNLISVEDAFAQHPELEQAIMPLVDTLDGLIESYYYSGCYSEPNDTSPPAVNGGGQNGNPFLWDPPLGSTGGGTGSGSYYCHIYVDDPICYQRGGGMKTN